ncbi:MAG: Coenzyme F420 hydrogenase/dehydrogenase, beta subunit C-terminal domain [Candidatus Hermodarchaeota archaeon]
MGIEEENKEITDAIRENAKKLLSEKQVDVVIGYSEGTVPLSSTPIIIRKAEDVEKLVWNNLCYINLARYLAPLMPQLCDSERKSLRIGMVAKGCVGRAINLLAAEKQVDINNIKMIGFNCNGNVNRSRIDLEVGEKEILDVSISGDDIIVKGKDWEKKFEYNQYINELCKICQVKSPSATEVSCVGECQELNSIHDEFADIAEFESKSADEKWAYIKDILQVCTLCYSCRQACPVCYCNLCFVDQNKPIWFGKTTEYTDIFTFHLVRATHIAGRCVACGACSSVCPVGIDLNLITRKLEKIVKERFDYTSGLNAEKLPPMMEFRMEDAEEFMLEED